MNWQRIGRNYLLLNVGFAAVVLGVLTAEAVLDRVRPDRRGAAVREDAQPPASAPSSDAVSEVELRRRIAACGAAPAFITEAPGTLFSAARSAALPGLRNEAGEYRSCLRAVLDEIEAAGVSQLSDLRDELDARVEYVSERLRIRDGLAETGADVESRISALDAMFGRCADPPMGALSDATALSRYAAWLECRQREQEAILVEVQALRDAAAHAPLTPELAQSLERLDTRLNASAATLREAERTWATADAARRRAVAEAPRAESRVPSNRRTPTTTRSREQEPPCTCDDARRGYCGSPATHCYSDEEIAERRLASRRAAARREQLRREREVAAADRDRQEQRRASERTDAASRELVHVLRGQGSTQVQACHEARASAVNTAFAPLSFSSFRDFDVSRDQLCSCRREGDTWYCETTAVYRDVNSLADRWPAPGFASHASRELACSRAKASSRAVASVTSARFLGYRVVLGGEESCRCERDERLDQWACSVESWMGR